jgi:hypothetical protein
MKIKLIFDLLMDAAEPERKAQRRNEIHAD